jgi:hypothetical protein
MRTHEYHIIVSVRAIDERKRPITLALAAAQKLYAHINTYARMAPAASDFEDAAAADTIKLCIDILTYMRMALANPYVRAAAAELIRRRTGVCSPGHAAQRGKPMSTQRATPWYGQNCSARAQTRLDMPDLSTGLRAAEETREGDRVLAWQIAVALTVALADVRAGAHAEAKAE